MFTLRRECSAGGSSSWIDGPSSLSAPNTHYSSIHSFSRCISLFLSASLAHFEGTFAITLPLFLFLPPSIPSGPFSKVLAINHNSRRTRSIHRLWTVLENGIRVRWCPNSLSCVKEALHSLRDGDQILSMTFICSLQGEIPNLPGSDHGLPARLCMADRC